MEPNWPSIDGWDRITTRHVAPAVTAATLPPASIESSAGPRRRRWTVALYLYTGATIVVGLAALAWASLTLDIWPEISPAQAGGKEGILLGLLFWILIGLLGGTRVEQLHGFGVLTFHLPFIIAAYALGGPVAGGWVAMISTLEARSSARRPGAGRSPTIRRRPCRRSSAGSCTPRVRAPLATSRTSRRRPSWSRSSSPRSSCPACRRPWPPARSSCATG